MDLKDWWHNRNEGDSLQNMSSVVCEDYLLSTTAKILGQVELLNEETVINEIELQIVWFHNKLVYESCSNHYCMKKLSVEEQSGVQKFYCTHCKQYQDEPCYRYVVTCKAIDSFGELTLNIYNEASIQLFRLDADNFHKLSV